MVDSSSLVRVADSVVDEGLVRGMAAALNADVVVAVLVIVSDDDARNDAANSSSDDGIVDDFIPSFLFIWLEVEDEAHLGTSIMERVKKYRFFS